MAPRPSNSSARPDRLEDWNKEEVCRWASDEVKLPADIVEKLDDHEVDGLVLATLSEEDMRVMGIQQLGFRRRLNVGITRVLGDHEPPPFRIQRSELAEIVVSGQRSSEEKRPQPSPLECEQELIARKRSSIKPLRPSIDGMGGLMISSTSRPSPGLVSGIVGRFQQHTKSQRKVQSGEEKVPTNGSARNSFDVADADDIEEFPMLHSDSEEERMIVEKTRQAGTAVTFSDPLAQLTHEYQEGRRKRSSSKSDDSAKRASEDAVQKTKSDEQMWYAMMDPFELENSPNFSPAAAAAAAADEQSDDDSAKKSLNSVDEMMLMDLVNPFELEEDPEPVFQARDRRGGGDEDSDDGPPVSRKQTDMSDFTASMRMGPVASEYWQDITAPRAKYRAARLRLSMSSQRGKIQQEDEEHEEEKRQEELEGSGSSSSDVSESGPAVLTIASEMGDTTSLKLSEEVLKKHESEMRDRRTAGNRLKSKRRVSFNQDAADQEEDEKSGDD